MATAITCCERASDSPVVPTCHRLSRILSIWLLRQRQLRSCGSDFYDKIMELMGVCVDVLLVIDLSTGEGLGGSPQKLLAYVFSFCPGSIEPGFGKGVRGSSTR